MDGLFFCLQSELSFGLPLLQIISLRNIYTYMITYSPTDFILLLGISFPLPEMSYK